MSKKLLMIFTSCAALLGTQLVAAMQVNSAAPYFGIAAGYDSSNLKNVFNTNASIFGATNFNFGKHVNGYTGGAFTGYAWNFDNGFYLAGEFSGDVNSNKHRDRMSVDSGNNQTTGFDSQKLYTLNVALLPGISINDNSLLYGRAGMSYSRFKTNIYIADEGLEISPNNIAAYNNGFWGMNLGLGYQMKLQSNLSIRAEYDYTDYRSKKFNSQALRTAEVVHLKANPYSNNIKLAVLYGF